MDDLRADGTGSYTLYLQRTNNPGNATDLEFSETVNSEIEAVGAFDTYTFLPKQNDNVNISLVRMAGSLNFLAAIYNPSGDLVCSDYTTGNTLEIANCAITVDGEHALFVSDTYDDAVGTYALTLGCNTGICGQPPPIVARLYLPLISD
jgi:hypothetical protein